MSMECVHMHQEQHSPKLLGRLKMSLSMKQRKGYKLGARSLAFITFEE
jgi:hypothetical protein